MQIYHEFHLKIFFKGKLDFTSQNRYGPFSHESYSPAYLGIFFHNIGTEFCIFLTEILSLHKIRGEL